MKRRSMKHFIILCAALVLMFAGFTVQAKTTYRIGSKKYTYKADFYSMDYQGKTVTSAKYPALMINDNVMIPYRYVLYKSGPKIKSSYKSSSKRVTFTRGKTKVKMYVNKKYIYINGKKKKLNTAPLIAKVNGKSMVMVPAKATCAALNLGYLYVRSEKTIYVTPEVTEEKNQGSVVTVSSSVSNKTSLSNSKLVAKDFLSMTTAQFIEVMGPIAREDYKKTGVLASVTLAQAINESGWGKTGLAQKGNNMFGMKTSLSGNTWTGSVWDGKSYLSLTTTEEKNGKKYKIVATFRKYPNVAMSVADHSAYLCNATNGINKRYAGLTSTKSYSKQLSIIQKGGYCTWSGYISELTSIIKKYNLTRFDVK